MSTTLTTIPLCRLKRSNINIRKTDRLADIEQLAASIEASGLLENLIVRPSGTNHGAGDGIYEVVAGGRRLAALKLLAKRKKIARDHPVPCLVLETQDAGTLVGASLAENIVRAPVHPADQFDAFARLRAEGLSAEDIAARFGVTSTVVLQRLKLAAVSPRLVAEYRAGEMTLEQLMAFAISDDREMQETVWFATAFGDPSPQAIRRRLTSAHVEGADRRARYVGAKAYEAAGGAIVRDLFEPEDEGYFADSTLLDRLASEKLQAEAEAVRAEGWGWVETALEADFDRLARFERIGRIEVPLGGEEEAHLASLCERYDELVAAIEDEGDEETSAELDRISADIEALQAKKESWPEEARAGAGVLVSLDYDGTLRIDRGLIRPGGRKTVAPGREPDARSGKPNGSPNGYSEALLVELSAQRTAALREVLAGQPERALIALLHALVVRIFYPGRAASCVEISPTVAELGKFSETVGESRAGAALLARHERWAARLPEPEALWGWIEGLPPADRLDLLAYCTAIAIDAVHRHQGGGERPAHADVLARATGLDMADWWTPTETGFLGRVTKDQILKAVAEGGSPQVSRRLAGLKKSKMAKKAEELLAVSRWLPEPLRTPASSAEPADEAAAVEPLESE